MHNPQKTTETVKKGVCYTQKITVLFFLRNDFVYDYNSWKWRPTYAASYDGITELVDKTHLSLIVS